MAGGRRAGSGQQHGDDGAHSEAADSPEKVIAPTPYLELGARSPCGEGASQEGFPCARNPPERWSDPLPGVPSSYRRQARMSDTLR